MIFHYKPSILGTPSYEELSNMHMSWKNALRVRLFTPFHIYILCNICIYIYMYKSCFINKDVEIKAHSQVQDQSEHFFLQIWCTEQSKAQVLMHPWSFTIRSPVAPVTSPPKKIVDQSFDHRMRFVSTTKNNKSDSGFYTTIGQEVKTNIFDIAWHYRNFTVSIRQSNMVCWKIPQ